MVKIANLGVVLMLTISASINVVAHEGAHDRASVPSTASCRVRIVTPDGGDVHSSSGGYSCEAGLTCEIDLVDANCNETFFASPKYGYSFKGWKSQHNGLCGGKTAASCNVKDSIVENSPSLGASENNVELLYLQPVFVADKNNKKPGNVDLLCTVNQCSVEAQENREDGDSVGNYSERCENLQGGSVRIIGTGKQNELRLISTELSPQVATGLYEALPKSHRGWKFVGQIGLPATTDGVTLIIQVNKDPRLCNIEYVEGPNTPNQLTLTINGVIEHP